MALLNGTPLPSLGRSSLTDNFDTTPAPSLSESKLALLAKVRAEKEAKLRQEKTPSQKYNELLGLNNQSSYVGDLVDQAQGSLYNALGTSYDLASDVGSAVSEGLGFGPINGRVQYLDNLSNQQFANEQAGFSPEAQATYQNEMANVEQQYKDGNVLGSIGSAIGMAPKVLAGSAGPIAEIIAGTVLTGGVSTVGKVAQGIAAVTKQSPKLGKVLNYINKSFPITGGTVLYSADVVNQHMDNYKINNDGKDMPMDLAVKTAAWATLNSAMAFGNFKQVASTVTPKEFIKDAANLVKTAGLEKGAKIVAEGIAKNSAEILAAGGKEALQEYSETWNEIIATAREGSDVFTQKNKDKAAVGAILGFGAGSAPKAVTAVPKAAVQTTVGTTKAVASKVAGKLQDSAAKGALKLLPEEDRAKIKAKYVAEDEYAKASKKAIEAENVKLAEVKTVQDLKSINNNNINEAIDIINKVNTEEAIKNKEESDKNGTELKKAKVFTDEDAINMAKKAIAANKDKIIRDAISLQGRRAKDATFRVLNNSKDIVENKLNDLGINTEKLKETVIDGATKTYTVAKDISGKTIDGVVNIKSSAARGVYDGLVKDTINISKDTKDKIDELTVEDLDAIYKTLDDSSVGKEAKKLFRQAKILRKKAKRTVLGREDKSLINELPEKSNIEKIYDGMSGLEVASLGNDLINLVTNNKVTNPKLAKKITDAIDAYKKSEFANSEVGKVLDKEYEGFKKVANKVYGSVAKDYKESDYTLKNFKNDSEEEGQSKIVYAKRKYPDWSKAPIRIKNYTKKHNKKYVKNKKKLKNKSENSSPKPSNISEKKINNFSDEQYEKDSVAERAAKTDHLSQKAIAGGIESLTKEQISYATKFQKEAQKATAEAELDKGTSMENVEDIDGIMPDEEAKIKAKDLNIELCT